MKLTAAERDPDARPHRAAGLPVPAEPRIRGNGPLRRHLRPQSPADRLGTDCGVVDQRQLHRSGGRQRLFEQLTVECCDI